MPAHSQVLRFPRLRLQWPPCVEWTDTQEHGRLNCTGTVRATPSLSLLAVCRCLAMKEYGGFERHRPKGQTTNVDLIPEILTGNTGRSVRRRRRFLRERDRFAKEFMGVTR